MRDEGVRTRESPVPPFPLKYATPRGPIAIQSDKLTALNADRCKFC
eukprot:COSAG03_NODE_1922_length_3353_cov_2.699447_2_plen_46_part_00